MDMEAKIFTGSIYDHLLPHAEKVKVAHPLMLRAISAAKKKNDKVLRMPLSKQRNKCIQRPLYTDFGTVVAHTGYIDTAVK